MTKSVRTRVLAALLPAALATAVLSDAPAGADERAALAAPGAPMRSDVQLTDIPLPEYLNRQVCSQGVIGTVVLPDGTQQRVLVTAGHCLAPMEGQPEFGDRVFAPTRSGGDTVIGYRDQAHAPATNEANLAQAEGNLAETLRLSVDSPDWGTAVLNEGVVDSRMADSVDKAGNAHGTPVRLTAIRDYPDLAPGQYDFSVAGQPICKDGTTTGRSCGTLLVRSQNGLWAWDLGYVQGDSGGVNFDPNTGEVLGVSSMVFGPITRAQPADVAVEQAYGIPDGQVNERFSLTDSEAKHSDDLRTFGEDEAVALDWAQENGAMPDFVAEHQRNVAAAEADAAEYSQRIGADAQGAVDALGAGQDPASAFAPLGQTLDEAGQSASHHAEVLPESAVLSMLSQ